METLEDVCIVDDILPSAHLEALEADADALAACPNYWVPREVVEGGQPALTAAEQAVSQLLRELAAPALAALGGGWRGAEYWCQVYEGGRGLGFHFDKDEHAMAREGRMANPLLSSVLYLTGSPADAARQAPTVLIDQRYAAAQRRVLPEHPAWSALVFPARNRYCLFDGARAHGVLEGTAPAPPPGGEPPPAQAGAQPPPQAPPAQQRRQQQQAGHPRRVTFLVNWWAQRPESVERATAEDVARGRLAAARPELEPGAAGAAAALAALDLGDPPGQQQQQQQQQQRRRVRLVRVEAPALEPGDVLPVDELLEAAGVCLNARGAVAAGAVLLAHAGLALVPLEEQQVDPAHPLQVLAALVPTADLADGGSGSGSDGGSDSGSGSGSSSGDERGKGGRP